MTGSRLPRIADRGLLALDDDGGELGCGLSRRDSDAGPAVRTGTKVEQDRARGHVGLAQGRSRDTEGRRQLGKCGEPVSVVQSPLRDLRADFDRDVGGNLVGPSVGPIPRHLGPPHRGHVDRGRSSWALRPRCRVSSRSASHSSTTRSPSPWRAAATTAAHVAKACSSRWADRPRAFRRPV